MSASREFLLTVITDTIPVNFEAHFDPETELWNYVVRRIDRIVEVGKCESHDIWATAKTETESCVMLYHDATNEPASALDGVEPEAQA